MKLTLVKIGWLFGLIALVAVSIAAIEQRKAVEIGEVNIHIEEFDEGQYFLTEMDLREELDAVLDTAEGLVISDLDIDAIESALTHHPYIRDVNVYVTAQGDLGVRVDQKKPLARVIMASAGHDYYIDHTGAAMPLSRHYTARVPVISGAVPSHMNSDEEVSIEWQKMIAMMTALTEDKFMRPLVEQVHFAADGDVLLVPKVGSQKIRLGNTENIEEKIADLTTFYREVMAKGAWDKYYLIDISVNGQVICKKKTDS